MKPKCVEVKRELFVVKAAHLDLFQCEVTRMGNVAGLFRETGGKAGVAGTNL